VNDLTPPASREVSAPVYTPAYLRYALGLLFLVYAVNFLDRQILAILLQSIKQELRLSDVQLGLLSGTASGFSTRRSAFRSHGSPTAFRGRE
jgi:sugar phosphate permease